jgi:tRNA 2-selenouridine synthase
MHVIQAHELITDQVKLPVLDVRTPAEFAQGHIPGAMNVPLFTNEERAEVGTLYKQVSKEKAFLRGLELAGVKMASYDSQAIWAAPGKQAIVHCWRGGMRSKSIATLLKFCGFDIHILEGGYKAYRNYLLEQFSDWKCRFVVLGGYTGTGKTEILRNLASFGEQVIDLEAIARHKGSAFGALGEMPQPTVEQFENDLFSCFCKIDPQKRTWVENESRSIGRVFVPQGFWEQIKSSPLLHVEMPFHLRVGRLIVEYATYPKEELEESLLKIERRMGGQHVKAALEAFRLGDLKKATSITLNYYDKTYEHATSKGNFSKKMYLPVETAESSIIAKKIIEFANEHNL